MITSIPNAFAAEAMACVQAIQFGAESGYLRVDIEGNNMARTFAKKGLRVGDDTYLNNGLSRAVLAAVAEDCRGLLRNRSVNRIESGKRTWPWLGCPEKQSFRKVGQSMGNDKESDRQVLVASCGFVLGFKEKCRIKIKVMTFRLIGPLAVLF
ncbi:hypothetical protein Goshw_017313 [Gossypium schwendimanii]|uniref:RNase H type-1 domain-containing protein n=1 Tax=Gossypium schwendimanii TaxID=34291 RepID=A0A7J9LAS1_GOSSC|nr:hypothetical protein [Gossypium schwendimanii]